MSARSAALLASLDLMSRDDALDIELPVSASEEDGRILPSRADSEARVYSCMRACNLLCRKWFVSTLCCLFIPPPPTTPP